MVCDEDKYILQQERRSKSESPNSSSRIENAYSFGYTHFSSCYWVSYGYFICSDEVDFFPADQTDHSFVNTMASFLRKYPLLSGCLPVITNRNCFVPAELKEYLPRRSVFMAEFGAY